MCIAVRDEDPHFALEIAEQIVEVSPDIIVDAVEAGSCKVIGEVMISDLPVYPEIGRITLIMALSGIVLSIAVLSIIFLSREKHIIDDNDMGKYIDRPVLGVIPEVDAGKKEKRRQIDDERRTLKSVTDSKMPFEYVEAYKALRTNLKFITATKKINSFVITSALARESKSNVAFNLAVTIAKEGKKVILIDGDLRKPALNRMLHLHSSCKGLTNLLMGECTIEETVICDSKLPIDVLPSGAIPPNPSEVLALKSMEQLLLSLKKSMILFSLMLHRFLL